MLWALSVVTNFAAIDFSFDVSFADDSRVLPVEFRDLFLGGDEFSNSDSAPESEKESDLNIRVHGCVC